MEGECCRLPSHLRHQQMDIEAEAKTEKRMVLFKTPEKDIES